MRKTWAVILVSIFLIWLPAVADARHSSGRLDKHERKHLTKLIRREDKGLKKKLRGHRRGVPVLLSTPGLLRDNFGGQRSSLAHHQNLERLALRRHQMEERRLARSRGLSARALAVHQREEWRRLALHQRQERLAIRR